MDKWKEIWNAKNPNLDELRKNEFENVFMELKRLTGNDTTGHGVSYDALISRFQQFKKELLFNCEDLDGKQSVFEVGCGSGANLILFQKLGYEIGGIDYSEALIQVADKCLSSPIELICDEADKITSDIKYNITFSNSAFEYFSDENYAWRVLERMNEKTKNVMGILEVHDIELKEEFISYRKETIENYEQKYKDLNKLFLPRTFFLDFAEKYKLDIKFCYPAINGYWNTKYIYDVYMYKY